MRILSKSVPVLLAAGALVLLALWLRMSPAVDVARRLPGPPPPPSPPVGGQGRLVDFGRTAPQMAGMWPGFRGPNGDNVRPDSARLSRDWPADGPRVLWQVEMGEGYAGAAVRDGRVYVLDYDPPDAWDFLAPRGDVKDWAALGRALAAGAGGEPSPARRVWERLSEEGRRAVERLAGGEAPEGVAPDALLGDLNRLLGRRDFYEEVWFPGIRDDLTGEARRLLRHIRAPGAEDARTTRDKGNPRDVRRFNRMLFDRLWPEAVERSRHGDALRCLSLATGEELWRYQYPVKVKRFHGMSRTVPAVTEKYVVSLGPKCHVVCLDARSGEFLWTIDLVEEYGTEVPQWYAGQCPLVDGGRVILAPAGKNERVRPRYREPENRSTPMPEEDVLLMAVDLETGRPAWTAPNRRGWEMTHSSIVPMEVGGRRMYVYCAGTEPSAGVVGVEAETGEILWEFDGWKVRYAMAPTPLVVGDGRLFLVGGYGAGCMMIRVRPEEGGFTVERLFEAGPKVCGSGQHTPVLYEGRVYVVLSSRGGAHRGQLVCLDLEGNHRWTSGPEHRFDLGPYVVADGLIYALDDHGRMTMAEATDREFRPLASVELWPDGHEAWGPLAVVGGRLIARDYERMVCLDVSAEGVDRETDR